MNALQRDLKKLVPLVESLGKETIAADRLGEAVSEQNQGNAENRV